MTTKIYGNLARNMFRYSEMTQKHTLQKRKDIPFLLNSSGLSVHWTKKPGMTKQRGKKRTWEKSQQLHCYVIASGTNEKKKRRKKHLNRKLTEKDILNRGL
ncbi:hypothetical protein LOAG_09308 [Loa loa]|uniref:Uncharacterized protein n=1 Tax=Loa loa TaxID=7209 RepID=A0A1S0TRX9_LOALO|nr:hypothetical protein LOAG_09308 [Loa loa]EFO19186.1 hypothetical protein LOAG_09308 [Loa loa]